MLKQVYENPVIAGNCHLLPEQSDLDSQWASHDGRTESEVPYSVVVEVELAVALVAEDVDNVVENVEWEEVVGDAFVMFELVAVVVC